MNAKIAISTIDEDHCLKNKACFNIALNLVTMGKDHAPLAGMDADPLVARPKQRPEAKAML